MGHADNFEPLTDLMHIYGTTETHNEYANTPAVVKTSAPAVQARVAVPVPAFEDEETTKVTITRAAPAATTASGPDSIGGLIDDMDARDLGVSGGGTGAPE
jgi:hypothetical protein